MGGEAAALSLKAIGKQDTHLLSKDPEDTFFKYDGPRTHARFRKYHNVHTVTEGIEATWPFGETVRVELHPQHMGDLLNNVWIHMTLPDWGFDDIVFNETTQRVLFDGQTLQEFGYPTFRDWWLAGAPNAVGITLPIFQFPDFKSFLSFEQQFQDLLLTLLPPELFVDIPANVLFALLEILSGTVTPGPELIEALGIDEETTTIPAGVLAVLRGEVGITADVVLQQLNPEIFAVLPDIVKQIILQEVPPPAFTLPEIAFWAWDMQLLGRKIIKNIKFKVDNQVLEEISADWCIIYDNMYTTDSQKMSANALYNRNLVGGELSQPSAQSAAQSNDLFIHIPFFFSHNYGGDAYPENSQDKSAFPLCAIHKQKITLEIEFFKQSHFTLYNQRVSDNVSTRGPPETPPAKKLKNFKVITEEITLSPEERVYFKRPLQELTYDFVVKHSSILLEPEKRNFVVQLEPNVPVKCFHWFFRYRGYEDEDEYRSLPVDDPTYVNEWFYSTTANRFNFTRSQIKDMSEPHLLKSAFFTIHGERIPNVSNNDKDYFFNYVPLRAKLARSATNVTGAYNFEPPAPNYLLNYIYSYAFAMFPKSASLSGFLDFSTLQSDKTNLHLELVDDTDLKYGDGSRVQNPEYTFHMYYTAYKKLTFNDGFLLQG